MTNIVYSPIIDGQKSIFLYKSNFFTKELLSKIKEFVKSQTYRDGMCVSGKEIPRKQLWFQKDGEYFCKSWKQRYERWEANEVYPDILNEIVEVLNSNEELIQTLKIHDIEIPDINSCLINQYRDGNDSIRAHRDTHLSFGDNPVIIGVSIGDERVLRVRRLHNPDDFKSLKVHKESDENIDFQLEENSIFVMAGYSQTYFSHEIPKMPGKGERFSMTFRHFIK